MIVLSISFSEEYYMPADLGELGIIDYKEEIIFLSLGNFCNNTGITTQHVLIILCFKLQ